MRVAILVVVLLLSLVARADPAEPLGTWYLNSNGFRTTVFIVSSGAAGYRGSLTNESGGSESVDNITWVDSTRQLQFRLIGRGFWQWYRGTIVDGVIAGRFSHSGSSPSRPSSATEYRYHVTGWNSAFFDRSLAPRVWQVVMNTSFRARLRIDRAQDGSGFAGRFKTYATTTLSPGEAGEEPEYDIEVTHWDGTTLRFTRRNPAWTQEFTGTVSGRTISGTFRHSGGGSFPWSGTRAEILTYGYGLHKEPDGRRQWQERTRRQLQHLMMARNPRPASVTRVTTAASPIASVALPPERDDNPDAWPQRYTLTQTMTSTATTLETSTVRIPPANATSAFRS